MIFSSSIQTLLSVPESHQFNPSVKKESRTIPPIGNFTLPRRKLFQFSIAKIQQSQMYLVSTFLFLNSRTFNSVKVPSYTFQIKDSGYDKLRQSPPLPATICT